MNRRVITFGTFDLFHIGHLNILKRCKEYGDYLIVGVSSDELNFKKGKQSVIPLEQRIEIVASIKYVDEVFIEESLENKNNYIKQYDADILIMGDDWKNKFDWVDCPVIYLERTHNISSSEIKKQLSNSIL
jgi:glycerol-3-phosphate cytidylyltransferase